MIEYLKGVAGRPVHFWRGVLPWGEKNKQILIHLFFQCQSRRRSLYQIRDKSVRRTFWEAAELKKEITWYTVKDQRFSYQRDTVTQREINGRKWGIKEEEKESRTSNDNDWFSCAGKFKYIGKTGKGVLALIEGASTPKFEPLLVFVENLSRNTLKGTLTTCKTKETGTNQVNELIQHLSRTHGREEWYCCSSQNIGPYQPKTCCLSAQSCHQRREQKIKELVSSSISSTAYTKKRCFALFVFRFTRALEEYLLMTHGLPQVWENGIRWEILALKRGKLD